MATNEKMLTIGELKRLVAEIDPEHDWKDLWYIEVMGWSDHLVIHEDQEDGVTIFGERG